jgi:hypothetical protein
MTILPALRVANLPALLTHDDAQALSAIVDDFRPHQRGGAIAQFENLLSRLRAFCLADQQKAFDRCCACGVIWVDDHFLAIRPSLFSKSIGRSKSFVNTLFQTIGYNMYKMSKERSAMLTQVFPQLPPDGIKSWTFRARRHRAEAIPPPEELRMARPFEVVRLNEAGRIRLPSVQALLSQQGWMPPQMNLANGGAFVPEERERSGGTW